MKKILFFVAALLLLQPFAFSTDLSAISSLGDLGGAIGLGDLTSLIGGGGNIGSIAIIAGVVYALIELGAPPEAAVIIAAIMVLVLSTCYQSSTATNFTISANYSFSDFNQNVVDSIVTVDLLGGQVEREVPYHYAIPLGAKLRVTDIGFYEMRSYLDFGEIGNFLGGLGGGTELGGATASQENSLTKGKVANFAATSEQVTSTQFFNVVLGSLGLIPSTALSLVVGGKRRGYVWLEVDGNKVNSNGWGRSIKPGGMPVALLTNITDNMFACFLGTGVQIAYSGLSSKFTYRFFEPGPHSVKLLYCASTDCNNIGVIGDWNILVVDWKHDAEITNPEIGFMKGYSESVDKKIHTLYWKLHNRTKNTLILVDANVPYGGCPYDECYFDLSSFPQNVEIPPEGYLEGIPMIVKAKAPLNSPEFNTVKAAFTIKDRYGFKEIDRPLEFSYDDITISFDVVKVALYPYKKSGIISLPAGTYYMQVCSDSANREETESSEEEFGANYEVGGLFGVADSSGNDLNIVVMNRVNDCKAERFSGNELMTSQFTLTSAQDVNWVYFGYVGKDEYKSDWAKIGTAVDANGYVRGDILDVTLGKQRIAESTPEHGTVTLNALDGEVSADEFNITMQEFIPVEQQEDGTMFAGERYMLKNIEFPSLTVEGPVFAAESDADDSSIYITDDGKVFASTYFVREIMGDYFAQRVASLWDWREDYIVKVKSGLQDVCYGKNGMIGFSGEDVMPRVKYSWSWDDSKGITWNSCDANNENYIYCDSTQFTIMLLKRLKRLSEIGSDSNVFKYADEIDKLIHFDAYLIYDGYSDDFRNDFDNYFKSSDPTMTTPLWYTDNLWDKYVLDFDRLKFEVFGSASKTLPSSGIYHVDLIFNFAHPAYIYQFNHAGEIDSNITVRFTKVRTAMYDNPFYYLPIDSSLGYDPNTGILSRDGYGVSYSGDISGNPISITGEGVELIKPLPSEGSNALVDLEINRISEFNYVQFTNPGAVLDISKKDSGTGKLSYKLDYSPCYATPVIGKSERNSADRRFSGMFYNIKKGGTYLTNKDHLNSWTAIGETIEGYECRDYQNVPLFVEKADSSASANGFEYYTETPAYGFGWANNYNLDGSIYAITSFFTPLASSDNQKYTFTNLGDQGKFYAAKPEMREFAKSEWFYLDSDAEAVSSLQDTVLAIGSSKLCMAWSTNKGERPDKISFFWNYGKLIADSIAAMPSEAKNCINAPAS